MAWAPDYVTSAVFKAYARISDTVDDAEVALAITSASRAIDLHTNRQFGLVATAEERTYTAVWDRRRQRYVIEIDDLMTQTGLVVDTDDGAITQFALQPPNAAQMGHPWQWIVIDPESSVKPPVEEDGVTVTARWGWTTVPDAIEQATLIQASRFFTRRNAPFGIAGSPDVGSEMRLLDKVDPDVAVALGPYIRWWAAV